MNQCIKVIFGGEGGIRTPVTVRFRVDGDPSTTAHNNPSSSARRSVSADSFTGGRLETSDETLRTPGFVTLLNLLKIGAP